MLYSPVLRNRLFAPGMKYSKIDWTSFPAIVDAFQARIDEWYLEPVRVLRDNSNGHGGFAALAMCCILIDCMCQFEGGKVISNRSLFIGFIKRKLRHYRSAITPPILFPEIDSRALGYRRDPAGAIKTIQLTSIADVLYNVFRCGILHSAHAPLVGVISGIGTRRFSVRRASLSRYGTIGVSGSNCPTVVLDPWKLFEDIEVAFEKYLNQLRNSKPTSPIRLCFNVKFEDAFGISITAVT